MGLIGTKIEHRLQITEPSIDWESWQYSHSYHLFTLLIVVYLKTKNSTL